MSMPIIVMGANGRMGRTICALVQEDPAFTPVSYTHLTLPTT